jgi:small subunit ribosomal protein S6
MPETIRFYEVVYIIAPDRNDDQIQATVEKYNNLIKNQGATIERTDIWERRRLAYPIKGYTEGIYVVVHFHGLPAAEAELKRVFLISEDTLRFIIVRPDEDVVSAEPAPRLYRPEAAAPVAAPTPVAVAEPIVEAAAPAQTEAEVVAEAPAAEETPTEEA